MGDGPQSKKIWFPAKTHGWGWGPPVCWQGWAVIAVYVVALAAGGFVILRDDPRSAPVFVGYAFGLSVLLCLVSWWKGEKPEWRWGENEKKR
jgi:hypothetical protein